MGFIASLLPGYAAVAIPQEQGGSNAPKKRSRWDRQPHLTDVAVRVEERVYKSTPQGELKLQIWSPKSEGKDRTCMVFFFFFGGSLSGTYR